MKISKFNRVLTYVKPYWGSVTMNIVFTILATIFSLFSFSMIVPFLNLLFNPDNLITVKPEFSLSSDVLLETIENSSVGDVIELTIFRIESVGGKYETEEFKVKAKLIEDKNNPTVEETTTRGVYGNDEGFGNDFGF